MGVTDVEEQEERPPCLPEDSDWLETVPAYISNHSPRDRVEMWGMSTLMSSSTDSIPFVQRKSSWRKGKWIWAISFTISALLLLSKWWGKDLGEVRPLPIPSFAWPFPGFPLHSIFRRLKIEPCVLRETFSSLYIAVYGFIFRYSWSKNITKELQSFCLIYYILLNWELLLHS